MPQERNLQRSVLQWLKAQPFTEARNLHVTEYGVTGDPDIYGCRLGQMFLIELKQPGKAPTAIQRVQLAKWEHAGAKVAVIHSMDELQDFWRELL